MIISDHCREVCEMILYDADIGATIVHIDTAFCSAERWVVLSGMYAKKYLQLKEKMLAAACTKKIAGNSSAGVPVKSEFILKTYIGPKTILFRGAAGEFVKNP